MGRNGIRQRRVFIRHEVNELVWWFLDFLERIPEGTFDTWSIPSCVSKTLRLPSAHGLDRTKAI